MIQYHEEATSDRITITANDIDECTDIAQLNEWQDALENMVISIKSQLESRKEFETDDDEWAVSASKAYAFANTGIRRIRRRLKALGQSGEENRIRSLEARVAEFKKRESVWYLDRLFVEIATQKLDASTVTAITLEAARQLASSATLHAIDG